MMSQEMLRQVYFDQVAYNTVAQFTAMEKQYHKTMRLHGAYLEPFFWNPDGSLDYQLMLTTLDAVVRQGSTDLLHDLDKHPHVHRHLKTPHFWEHPVARTLDTSALADEFMQHVLVPWLSKKTNDRCTADLIEQVVLLPALDFFAWSLVASTDDAQTLGEVTTATGASLAHMLCKMVADRHKEKLQS